MKTRYLMLFFLPFPSLGGFLGEYLSGWHILSSSSGFFVSAVSMFLGPFLVAGIDALLLAKKWLDRFTLFVLLVMLQIPLFCLVPPGATAEMIGIAHRLKAEFQPTQLRATAEAIQKKRADGTLKTCFYQVDDVEFASRLLCFVNESELPESLRGRFSYVALQHEEGDTTEVAFALNAREGIVCDSKPRRKDFFHYSLIPYVHAYRLEK